MFLKISAFKNCFIHISSFCILAFFTCRNGVMDPDSSVTFLSVFHRVAQSSSHPLHPRHEDLWSVTGSAVTCELKILRPFIFIFFVAEKVELSELDLKVMLQNHCEKRKRQPVSYTSKREKKEIWLTLYMVFNRYFFSGPP